MDSKINIHQQQEQHVPIIKKRKPQLLKPSRDSQESEIKVN